MSVPFRFGSGDGPLARYAATGMVALLLAMNLIALVASFPHIVVGLREEGTSGLSGSLRLPYLPSGGEVTVVEAPGTVGPGDPFPVTVSYPSGKVPYGIQSLVFIPESGDGHDLELSWRMALSVPERRNSSCLVPGLPDIGKWRMRLRGSAMPGGMALYEVDLGTTVVVDRAASKGPGTMPVLREDLTVNDHLAFRTVADDAEQDGLSVHLDGSFLADLRQVGPLSVLDMSHVSQGWHVLSVQALDGARAEWVFLTGPSAGDVRPAPDIVLERAFEWTDSIFGQGEEGRITAFDGGTEVREGATYRVTLSYPVDIAGGMEGLEGLSRFAPHRAQGISVWGRVYPAIPKSGTELECVITLGSSTFGDGSRSLTVGPLENGANFRTRRLTVVLVEDRSISLELDPDPYGPEGPRPGITVGVTVTDRGYTLGRKDAIVRPSLHLDGEQVQGASSQEYGYWSVWNWSLSDDKGVSGSVLDLSVMMSFVYRDSLPVLVPLPPFVFGATPYMSGWALVAWFSALSLAIVGSIGLLGWQQYRWFRRPVPGEALWSGSDDAPLVRTSTVVASIIFFSVVSVLAFQVMEQPTPVPGFLSAEVPVHYRMLALAEASVWEEVITRVLYIGVPLSLMGLFGKRKGLAGGLFGGTGKVGRSEAALILLSASVFGLAHIGWGIWKVLPTFISGLLFGYLFVKVGVHATIAVHFFIDYSSFPAELFGIGGLAGPTTLIIDMVLFVLGCIFLGRTVWSATGMLSRSASLRRSIVMVTHCLTSTAMGFHLLMNGGAPVLAFVMLTMPAGYILFNGLRDILDLRKRGPILLVQSYLTLVLAPLGAAYVLSREEDEVQQTNLLK